MQLQFCEGDSHVLTCGIFKINILSANYGRLTGAQVCGWGPIKTTYCKANGALAKVQAHCQGRSHCTLRATNGEFGDPCPGTYKYLEVSYRCVRSTGYRGRLLTVCEYTSHLIECPYYKTIDIMSAYYGRKTGGHLCPGKVSTTYCPGYSDSRAIIERECQGYRWCRLRASNSVFGDPCVDTVKYIEVTSYHYYTRICERNSGGLDCYSGEIDIIRASYGRHRRGICISRGKDGNTGCHAFNSLSVVRHRCQGQRHCRLYAQNTEFGYDPCVDIEKYLEVASYHYYTRICERSSGGLDCYSGEIDIIRASYGRHRRGICISRGKDGNTGCHAFNSLSVVRHRCQGQRHCRLYAQNTEFGYDPCVDIEKYLEVSYRCVPRTGYRGRLLTICEYTSHVIECPYHKRIYIMSAYYGRKTGEHLCGGRVSTIDCPGYSDSRAIIERECQGYRRCRLRASNSVFGDPCVNTKKYIEV
ncbi:unnamed protein product, partial [Porites evermanni]